MSLVRTLLVNTSSNLGVMGVKLALTFIMTPIFLHNLGKYDMGIWEMLGAVLGYMGLLDIGLRPALSRYAARYKALNDQLNLEVTFASGLMFMCAQGAFLCALLVGWGLLFPATLAEAGNADPSRYTALLVIVGIQLGLSLPGAVAESYLEGFQKYYLNNNITIVNSLLGSAVVFWFITPENGLVLLALVNAVGTGSKYLVFHWLLSRQAHGGVRYRRGRFSFATLKEMLVFGGKSFVQGLSTRSETAIDSLVIGSFLGPAMVPLYAIPANLVGYLRTFGYTITHAFMPLFSQLHANDERERMLDIYMTSSRLAVGLILPLAVGMALVGAPFIALWLGPDFSEDADVIIALLVFFTVLPALNPFANRYLTGINQHGIYAKLLPLSALLNLLCSLALVKPLGIVGVAIGSVIPVTIFMPIIWRFGCRQLGTSMAHYMREAIVPALLPTLAMAAAVLGLRLQVGLGSYAMLGAAVALGAVVYFAVFWLVGLRPRERAWVVARLRR